MQMHVHSTLMQSQTKLALSQLFPISVPQSENDIVVLKYLSGLHGETIRNKVSYEKIKALPPW